MKTCTKCGKKKPFIEFYRHNGYKDGRCSFCKKCYSQYHKSPIGREKQRSNRLKKRFNITLEQYDKMLEEQNGVCAICKSLETKILWGAVIRLSVDHDHKTGKVRGLLCDRCNRALGTVNDDANLLKKLIKYLRLK